VACRPWREEEEERDLINDLKRYGRLAVVWNRHGSPVPRWTLTPCSTNMAVACGKSHTLVVGERGLAIFAWGAGDCGQLGTGNFDDQRVPAPVAGSSTCARGGIIDMRACIDMVAACGEHSAAITSTGELLTWGGGTTNCGQLGHGDEDVRVVPVALGLVRFGGSPVSMVACGRFHTLVVNSAGVLFAFGSGHFGQLGLGDTGSRSVPTEVGRARFGGTRIAYAAAGYWHSGAVTSEGRVWTWGNGDYGCLGHGHATILEAQLVPRELTLYFGSKAVMLAAGAAHTMLVTEQGTLWAWGKGSSGQLGLGDNRDRHVPQGVRGPFRECKVCMVACGHYHTAAMAQGGLWTWGAGGFGRLGHNDECDRLVPERVGADRVGGAKIATVDCGIQHTAAVTEEGGLYIWGAGTGLEDQDDKLVPTLVAPDLLGGARAGRYLPLSPVHTLAVAMGMHGRLGGGAAIHALAGKQELVQMVVEACRDWPEGPVGEAVGVVRLLGGNWPEEPVEEAAGGPASGFLAMVLDWGVVLHEGVPEEEDLFPPPPPPPPSPI
jgi:alpha-tubulin suppressor-like RCC1 family protein